jgi:uncharacterized protein (DUF3084 family)
MLTRMRFAQLDEKEAELAAKVAAKEELGEYVLRTRAKFVEQKHKDLSTASRRTAQLERAAQGVEEALTTLEQWLLDLDPAQESFESFQEQKRRLRGAFDSFLPPKRFPASIS